MTDEITKRRYELADRRSKRQCSTGNPDLDRAIAWYLKIGFEDGFDAGVSEMQAQIDELKQELANVDRAVLIAERRVHGDQADKMEASQEAAQYNWLDDQNEALKAQLKSKDAVIDVAVKSLEYYGSKSLGETGAWGFRKKFCFDMAQTEDVEFLPEPIGEKGQKYLIGGVKAREALEQIQKMLRKNEGDEQW